MLRSLNKLTGALCLFAFATAAITPTVVAAGSGSDPILHIIDPEKMAKTAEALESQDKAGTGKKPVLHVLRNDEETSGSKEAKKAATKPKSTAKATSKAKPKATTKVTKKAPAKSTQAKNIPAKKEEFAKLIRKAASKHGVPINIAKAVVEVESNFNPRARGRAGEVGLMQIKPATARGIGYRGSTKALYDPETNIEWGMKYLAGAHERAGGDLCGTILRYNAGHYAKRMNPISRRYCSKVKRIMASS